MKGNTEYTTKFGNSYVTYLATVQVDWEWIGWEMKDWVCYLDSIKQTGQLDNWTAPPPLQLALMLWTKLNWCQKVYIFQLQITHPLPISNWPILKTFWTIGRISFILNTQRLLKSFSSA